MTIRVFSAICSASAWAITWRVLRNYLDFFPASVSACLVFLGSDLFLYYSAEARFYGPYLLGITLLVYCYDLLSRKVNPGLLMLLFNAFCQCLAVSTSYVAGLYSAVVLLAVLLKDKACGLWRPRVYVSFVAGWFPILFCLQNIRGSGVDWIKRPDYSYIFHPFNPEIDVSKIYFALFILAVLAFFFSFKNESKSDLPLKAGVKDIAYLAVFLLAVPYLVLLISWLGKPMMVDRYYFPSLIGMVIFTGIIAQRTLGPLELLPPVSLKSQGFLNVLKATLLAALVLHPLLGAIHLKMNQAKPDGEPSLAANSQIIIADNSPTYLPLAFTRNHNGNLFMVVKPGKNQKEVQANLEKFHHNLQTIDINTLTAKYAKITLVEDGSFAEFLWVKSALLQRGYRPLESAVQNKTMTWTLLSNEQP